MYSAATMPEKRGFETLRHLDQIENQTLGPRQLSIVQERKHVVREKLRFFRAGSNPCARTDVSGNFGSSSNVVRL